LLCLAVAPVIGQGSKFHVERLAEGVYAVVRNDPPGLAVESNSLFIIGEKDVIVVDAQSNFNTTREVLSELRKLTPKPVKYVINTHWHDDHIIGNQIYRDAFPALEFIGHANSREYLPRQGVVNRENFHKQIPAVLERFRNMVKTGKNIRGEPMNDEERESMRSDISLAEGYSTVPPDFQAILPSITIKDQMTIYQGTRAIEVRYLGRGHTSGDIVVYIPGEGIVASGDLVVWPVPFIGAEQSHIGDWAQSLERLRSLNAKILVPGHGPVMHDDSYLRLEEELMKSVDQQVRAAVARGAKLDDVKKQVNLEQFRKQFAGDSRVRDTLFSFYVVGPAVAAAFNDASAGN
jgi:cyclase